MKYKTYEIKSAEDRVVTFVASDESVDRDKDIIMANGWVTENFMKSGSIIYGHDPKDKLPVAKPVETKIANDQLLIKAQFADEGTSEFTDAVYSLVNQGILRGVSVGFQALETPETNKHGGVTFTKQELLELSLTPIPSNANARVLVKGYSEEIQEKLLFEEKDEIEDEVQEEAQVAEPETKSPSEKEIKFLKMIEQLKTTI